MCLNVIEDVLRKIQDKLRRFIDEKVCEVESVEVNIQCNVVNARKDIKCKTIPIVKVSGNTSKIVIQCILDDENYISIKIRTLTSNIYELLKQFNLT